MQTPIVPAKLALFILCLLPLAGLPLDRLADPLDIETIEAMQRWTGFWTLNLLLLTLCISPLRDWTGRPWLIRLRRMLGRFTFFYAALHFFIYIGINHAFSVDAIARDILKHPFVTLGFAAFVLMIPLAVTSSDHAIRRLGGRRWQELHRSIYLITILGCLHYLWLSKPEAMAWPLACSAILGALLWWRIRARRRKSIPAPPPPQDAQPLKFFPRRPD